MLNNYSFNGNMNVPRSNKTFSAGAKKYNYTEIYSGNGLTKQTAKQDNRATEHKSKVANIFSLTMGQNHHFTLTVDCLMIDNAMRNNNYGKFLPIKSITYKPVSIESTKLNFGIFADFPLVHKRKMGSIQVTLLDTVDNDYEHAVFDWFNYCHYDGYVSPMNAIIQNAHYKEYDNQGRVCKHYYFEVVPDGDVSLNRNYENASLKEINFSMLITSPVYVEDYVTAGDELGEGASRYSMDAYGVIKNL